MEEVSWAGYRALLKPQVEKLQEAVDILSIIHDRMTREAWQQLLPLCGREPDGGRSWKK